MLLSPRGGRRVDLPLSAVGVALVVIGLVQLLSSPPAQGAALMTGAAVVGGMAIALGRAATVTMALTVAASVLAQVLTGQPPTFSLFVASLVATFLLARFASPVGLAIGLAGLLGAATAAGLTQGGDFPLELIYPVVYFGGAAAAGGWTRRAARISEVNRTNERIRQEHELLLAVSAERTQIARELHDVIAHGVSLMVLQAEGAQAVLSSRPARTHEALTVIQDTGRNALDELEQLLRVLRQQGDGAEHVEPVVHRGVADVNDIAEKARACGLGVTVDVAGEQYPLPDQVNATVYRVIQEAVTNVVKHARATSVAICMTYGPDCLVVDVTDDGRGLATAHASDGLEGHGLVGMRERVYACGGDLGIEPSHGGGVRVRAVLPVPA